VTGWPVSRVDHPSRTAVAGGLQRSTRMLGRAALGRILSDLAPGGVYLAAPVTWGAGGLLHHRFTLTAPGGAAVCFLWHCPAGLPGWALPTTLPCGARTFLDASLSCGRRRDRPASPSRGSKRTAARAAAAPRCGMSAGWSSTHARSRPRRVCRPPGVSGSGCRVTGRSSSPLTRVLHRPAPGRMRARTGRRRFRACAGGTPAGPARRLTSQAGRGFVRSTGTAGMPAQ